MDVGDAYLLLERDDRAVGSGLLTRPSGVSTDDGDVLFAIDHSGLRRLLIPVADTDIAEDRRSRGVALVADVLDRPYAALVCVDPALSRVFERLVDDTLRRIEARDVVPVRAVQLALGEWRAFLSAAGAELGRTSAVGLVGELEILRRLTDVPDPLDCWRGPTGAIHDFVRGAVEVEVKSTAAVDGNTITVSNLDQLDPPADGDLYLAVVHLRPADTAPSLQERVEALLRSALARDRFYDLLAHVDYVHGSDPDGHRYDVRTVRVWHVGERFPGLRRTDVADTRLGGVAKVRYDLVLDSCPPPLGDDAADTLLRSMDRSKP